MIEVEVRSFVSEEQFKKLQDFMKQNAKHEGHDSQTTYYFSGPVDLRIQKGNNYPKLWLKKGRLHEDFREEIEVKFSRDDFEKMENLMEELGYEVEMSWIRERDSFLWDGIKVTLDFTRRYGYIIELEKLIDRDYEKDKSPFLGMVGLPAEGQFKTLPVKEET